MDNLGALLPLVLLVVAFFFLVIRPARTRQRAFAKTQSELAPGTEVMISSGIFGEIVSIEDDSLHLRIATDTVIKVSRQAVARIVPPAAGPEPVAPDEGTDN